MDKCLKYIESKINKKKEEEEINKKIKEENNKYINENINVEFKENPKNLKFRETLTSNNTYFNSLDKFDVYISLQDGWKGPSGLRCLRLVRGSVDEVGVPSLSFFLPLVYAKNRYMVQGRGFLPCRRI